MGSRPRAFQWAIDGLCMLPLSSPEGGSKSDFVIFTARASMLSAVSNLTHATHATQRKQVALIFTQALRTQRNARNVRKENVCVKSYATQRTQRTQGKCLRKKLRKLRKTRFFANARNRTVFSCVSYASADQWHDCNSSRGIIMAKTHRLFDDIATR